jgi:hypothetical protein
MRISVCIVLNHPMLFIWMPCHGLFASKHTVKINPQIRTLFTIIYLCQCHRNMFQWSNDYRQGHQRSRALFCILNVVLCDFRFGWFILTAYKNMHGIQHKKCGINYLLYQLKFSKIPPLLRWFWRVTWQSGWMLANEDFCVRKDEITAKLTDHMLLP